jgi:predicted O-methyltransferase YrrM
MTRSLLRTATRIPGFHYANMIPRAALACSYYAPVLGRIGRWLVTSREDTNFSYDLREQNLLALACTISCITGVSKDKALAYIKEGQDDRALRDHVVKRTVSSANRQRSDAACRFGLRLGWYAMVRIMKPRIVVEAGVDKGLGAVSLAAALLRNREEGFDGRYYGTDNNANAGWLLSAPYDSAGKILYGDSNSIVEKIEHPIDLFINGIGLAAYEAEQYRVLEPRLTKGGVVLSETSRWSEALMKFSIASERDYIFFGAEPKDHWYPGNGIGFSFRHRDVRERLEEIREERGSGLLELTPS